MYHIQHFINTAKCHRNFITQLSVISTNKGNLHTNTGIPGNTSDNFKHTLVRESPYLDKTQGQQPSPCLGNIFGNLRAERTNNDEPHLRNCIGGPSWKDTGSIGEQRWKFPIKSSKGGSCLTDANAGDVLKQTSVHLRTSTDGSTSSITQVDRSGELWDSSTDTKEDSTRASISSSTTTCGHHVNIHCATREDEWSLNDNFLYGDIKRATAAFPESKEHQSPFRKGRCSDVSESSAAVQEKADVMLKHLGSNCDVPGALSLLSEMKLLGIPLTCEHYNNVLTACRDGKTAEVARYIYLCLKCDGLSPDVNTYMYLIEAHTAAGDLCSAFSLYRKMEKEGMKADLRIFCVLIDGLVSKGHAENAWRLYNYVRSWRLIEPDDQLLTIMIKACIQSEDAEKALSIYDEMLGMGLQPTSGTYEALIDCLSRRRAYAHKCFQLYNVMKSGNLPIGYRTLLHISRACELSGNTRKLKEILKEAHDLGFAIDEDLITTALLTFARNIQISEYPVSHKVNVMRRALQSLDAVWDLSNATTPKVLNAMIVLYESGGYYDYALDMLRYFAKLNMKPDKQTYCIILRIIGTHLRDPGRFFTIWDNVRTLLNPDAKLFHMALDMSICSNSAKRTISIMEEMYTSKVFPTPELTARLYKKARRVPQIHTVISKMINLEKRLTCDRSKKEPATLQSYIEEYKLGCAA